MRWFLGLGPSDRVVGLQMVIVLETLLIKVTLFSSLKLIKTYIQFVFNVIPQVS